MHSSLDAGVLVVYVAAVAALGLWLARRSRTAAGFMAASGRLPAWAVGLSLFGTFLSSNTFIGNTGRAFSENWNYFLFTLTLPVAAWIAVRWFVPFYRSGGEISAYHHLERRFGPWARIYTVTCYLLTQVARVGTILLGVAIGMHAVTGWDIAAIVLVTGVVVTLYTLVGGIEAVIWTDVMQSLVLSAGALLVVAVLWFGEPGGSALLADAVAADRFSLGSGAFDFSIASVWVVLLFGLFINLTNFGIDQNYVQRYHTARSLAAAQRSVWLGALIYIPVSALFFLIGSLLAGFYAVHAAELDAIALMAAEAGKSGAEGDFALPHFMARHLPPGVGGLLVAALFAAAMSTIDTSLNSSATITLRDLFRKAGAAGGERGQLRILRAATLFWGVIGTGVALLLIQDERNLLQIWWNLSGVFAGAMLGLFLLGLLARHTGAAAAAGAVVLGVLVIGWMSFSSATWMPDAWRSPLHGLMTTVVGTLTILLSGLALTVLFGRRATD
jgi:SSS family solute:Na+ symporter